MSKLLTVSVSLRKEDDSEFSSEDISNLEKKLIDLSSSKDYYIVNMDST